MLKVKVWVAAMAMVLFCCNALAAGMSNRVNHSKILQSMQDSENEKLRKLGRNQHERINWDKELNLTDEQKMQVVEVLKASKEKISEQMKIIEQAHKKINELHQEDDEKIRKILNERQQIGFDKIKRKQKKARGEKLTEEKPSRKKIKQY